MKKLRIGIEAGWLEDGPVSSQRVTRGILAGLAELRGRHDIVVFTRSGRSLEAFPDFEVRAFRRLPTTLLTNVVSLPRAARRAGVDVVVSNQFPPLRAPFCRIAVVYDAICFDRPEFFSPLERAYFGTQRLLLPRADWLCTISEAELVRIRRLGLAPASGSGVIPLGISSEFSVPASAESLAEVRARYDLPPRFVLYVGRLRERKNIANLIAGFMTSSARRSGYRLVLAGPTDRHDGGLRDAISAAGPAVHRIGYVDDVDLPVIYQAADAFAYVSLDEGFGLPPLEAMAAGVPVVVGSAPALLEVCDSHAIVVDPMDRRSIGEGIDRALSQRNPATRDRVQRHAGKYTWRRSAEVLLENVERAVALRDETRRFVEDSV